METFKRRAAGLDVHRDTVVACCRIEEPDGGVESFKKRFSTTSAGLAELCSYLLDAAVSLVVLEATGVYWKPVYYALEDVFDQVWLCNAQHVKNVPGRKTDLCDAEWLADVAAHGMVKASFVPPPPIRVLRDLTRHRRNLIDMRASEIQRLEKVLQDAGVKLTSVTSSVWSLSSRDIIEALIAGERDPGVLAELARGRMRPKIGQLKEALTTRFDTHHAQLCRHIIDHITFLDASIDELTSQIAEDLTDFESAVALVESVTGIGRRTAEVVIAEIGVDMSRFPTSDHLCSWAGLAPGNRESAGKRRPAGTRHGDPHLRVALVEAARAAARTKDSYYRALYARIARRRGPNKAAIAVAHSMLNTIWHLLTNGEMFHDPGVDYYDNRRDPNARARRLQHQIEALGFQVTVEPAAAA